MKENGRYEKLYIYIEDITLKVELSKPLEILRILTFL